MSSRRGKTVLGLTIAWLVIAAVLAVAWRYGLAPMLAGE